MNSTAKTLIPNKEWLIKDNDKKIGSIAKNKKGYTFLHKGKHLDFKNLADIKSQFGIAIFEEGIKKSKKEIVNVNAHNSIYDFPCSSIPHNPVYSIKKKLPLYAKSEKSKSLYCAGYYVIQFRKGWVKSFCPKLITLERYPYYGPFKTESEMKSMISSINKV